MDKETKKHTSYQLLSSRTKSIKSLLPFIGPAFIAGVAYIDPGNFATNIAAGSQYGYMLLWVVLVSNLMAILIQALSAKLGIATGKNLPEVSRENFPKPVSFGLWVQGELVVIATDLAEFIGAALGLYLLFGIPLLPSAIIAAVGSFAILELQRRGFRSLEAGIIGMVFIVVIAFGLQVLYSQPNPGDILNGLFTPQFKGVESVMLAAGILGATVMPHAIYLHSALTQKRIVGRTEGERKRIFRFEFIDILIAMIIAGVVNASMLIVAAALFHKNGMNIQDLDVAFKQFGELVGPFSAILFGIGLLASGLASSAVGTMSGDIIMQGFIKRRIPLYLRRAITVIPPILLIAIGVNPTTALVISQIILSFGIPFALIPLILFTSSKEIMGSLANHKITNVLAWAIALVIIALNIFLLIQTFISL
ncbi:Nramp family divalent metal transporter [Paenibacillus sp. FSL A5-0031]|uniref:Nramp family divalent metal transporter n=1 Tax=Paenibacillus sp. FSL A5-0031 TaxID=1920420 RepID=UPI00211617C9|nr:Nramp family divalent metal transporter [Paenibacillus sp. FSL A5-0031]